MEEKRTEQINIRVTRTEKEKLLEFAKSHKLTLTDYILSFAELKKPKFICADKKQLIREINFIGNNINQIARALNTNNDKATAQIALKRLESLESYVISLKGI